MPSRWCYIPVEQTTSVSGVHPAPGAIIIGFLGSSHCPVYIPHRGVGDFTDHLDGDTEVKLTHTEVKCKHTLTDPSVGLMVS